MSNEPVKIPASDDGDVTYLEKTLRHEPTDLLLDDQGGGAEIRAAWRGSIRLAVGTFVVFGIFWLFDVFSPSSSRGADENDFLLVLGAIFAVGVFVIRWIAFLVGEKQEAISEWCTLLAGKGNAADSVYSHIAGRLRERQLPLHHYVERRTTTEFHTTGNRLVLIDGHHVVYVSVFAYGTSLYLGWSMWRVRQGTVLLQQGISSSGTRLDPIGRILSLERLKAMREAVHAVCREALHTAVADVSVPQTYGFPGGMPTIEALPFGEAPRP